MPECGVKGCKNSPKYTQGLCSPHYMRKWRYGDVYGGNNGVTHGLSKSREYFIWASMKSRCLNPKDRSYRNYGGRGIKVCERWLEFGNFYKDMGIRPEGFSLERVDNNGGYSPDNCEWAARANQNHNRRPYNKLGVRGVTITPHNTYRVVVTKEGKTLRKNFKTLEEAIKGYSTLERSLYV